MNIAILVLFIGVYVDAFLNIKDTYDSIMNEHVEVIEKEKYLGNKYMVLKKITKSKYNIFM